MKKQFAVMFCLLAIFTCLVGCSTGSKASFPETFIGSVGQEETDALKTLGTTEQALSDYTVDVYRAKPPMCSSRLMHTAAMKPPPASSTTQSSPYRARRMMTAFHTCAPATTSLKSARRTVHDRREHGRRFRRRRYRYAFCGAAKRMQAAKTSAPYNTSGAASVKTNRALPLLLSERKRLGARKAHVFAERACTNSIKLYKKARKF